jgi:hypothetical protein
MSDYDDSFEPAGSNIDLSNFDDDFSSAEAPSFDEVPDSKYQVRIDAVRLDHSQRGDPMIKWDLLVIAGQHQGRHIFKNSVITPAALPYVKGDLKTVGLQLAKFSDLSARLEDLLNVNLEITKRTRGDYTNVYFNKRIEIAGGNSQPLGDDDSVPF